MNKARNIIRLNESQLKRMIAESVKRILKEEDYKGQAEDIYRPNKPFELAEYVGIMPYIKRKAKTEKELGYYYDDIIESFAIIEYGTYSRWDSYFDETGYGHDSGDHYEPDYFECYDEDAIRETLRSLGIEDKTQEVMKKIEEHFENYGDDEKYWSVDTW